MNHNGKRPFPDWLRTTWAAGEDFAFTKGLIEDLGLHTVCQSARCPNLGTCWKARTATFMILGSRCTRSCRFCSVQPGAPEEVDACEPERVAEAVARLGLRHAVITSVTRDDLPDGGAAHFAATVRAVRERNPDSTAEVLTPDFRGSPEAIGTVLAAGPQVFGHNIETVRRLYPALRGTQASYDRALAVLAHAAAAGDDVIVKSGMMVGHGETEAEVHETLAGLREAGCLVVTLGQYLRPGPEQSPVAEFVEPAVFEAYERKAYELGFAYAVAGPFVRSSFESAKAVEAVRPAQAGNRCP